MQHFLDLAGDVLGGFLMDVVDVGQFLGDSQQVLGECQQLLLGRGGLPQGGRDGPEVVLFLRLPLGCPPHLLLQLADLVLTADKLVPDPSGESGLLHCPGFLIAVQDDEDYGHYDRSRKPCKEKHRDGHIVYLALIQLLSQPEEVIFHLSRRQLLPVAGLLDAVCYYPGTGLERVY